jgi:hypothetical protein
VVDNLASKDRKSRRNDSLAESYKRILTSIIAELSNVSVVFRVLRQESPDFSIEISDIFFGPLNLCATADQKVSHRTYHRSDWDSAQPVGYAPLALTHPTH